jgi:hypothetical protein
VASYAVVNIDHKGGSSGARRLSLAIHRGLIAQEYQDRRDLERLRSGIDRCVPARRAVVLTGLGATLTLDNSALVPAQPRDMAPGIEDGGILEANNLHRLRTRPVFFVYALSASNIALLRAAHYALYYFPAFAPAIEIDQFNVDPYRSAMTALQTSGAHACFAIGGA